MANLSTKQIAVLIMKRYKGTRLGDAMSLARDIKIDLDISIRCYSAACVNQYLDDLEILGEGK